MLCHSTSCRKEELLCRKLRVWCYVKPLDKHPNQIEYRPSSIREPAHCWQWHWNCAMYIKVTQQLSTALVNNYCQNQTVSVLHKFTYSPFYRLVAHRFLILLTQGDCWQYNLSGGVSNWTLSSNSIHNLVYKSYATTFDCTRTWFLPKPNSVRLYTKFTHYQF